jgi:uncharacterized protein
VKDPHTVVKAGQVVRVKVLEVDEQRKRIALTMRLTDEAPRAKSSSTERRPAAHPRSIEPKKPQTDRRSAPPVNSAMADAFSKLKGR